LVFGKTKTNSIPAPQVYNLRERSCSFVPLTRQRNIASISRGITPLNQAPGDRSIGRPLTSGYRVLASCLRVFRCCIPRGCLRVFCFCIPRGGCGCFAAAFPAACCGCFAKDIPRGGSTHIINGGFASAFPAAICGCFVTTFPAAAAGVLLPLSPRWSAGVLLRHSPRLLLTFHHRRVFAAAFPAAA
jgi:hypothetical protein